MPYGLQIFRSDGSLWISPDVTPLNYIGKMQFSSTGTYATSIPASKSMMVFLRNDAGGVGTMLSQSTANGAWQINITQTGSSGTLYLFSNMVTTSHGYGIATYNSAGEMIWNTDQLPLQVLSVTNPYGASQTGSFSINTGIQLAVSPGICSTYIAPINPAAGQFLYGAMFTGANGTTIYGSRAYAIQVGGALPAYKYKENFYYIDISKYP